jgi:hypothetical protein
MLKESKDLIELSADELVGSLLAHEQRKNLKKKKNLSRKLCKQRFFSKIKQCISRRDNNTIGEVVIEDSIEIVAEENKVSQASRAQSREGEANKAEKSDVGCYNYGQWRH